MSFPRHQEIFPSDGGASPAANAPAHRLDEFPAGYSSAGCSPAVPASASPAGHQYAVMSSCRSTTFHRTVNCVLTVCVTPGGKRNVTRSALPNSRGRLPKWSASSGFASRNCRGISFLLTATRLFLVSLYEETN